MESVIGDVAHSSKATTAVDLGLEAGLDTRPDLVPCTVARLGHTDVVDVKILDDIDLIGILAKRSDTDAY